MIFDPFLRKKILKTWGKHLDQIHYPVMCVVPDTKIEYHALLKYRPKYMHIKLGTVFCLYSCYYYLMQQGVPNESNAAVVF